MNNLKPTHSAAEQLVRSFERGRLSRRQLVVQLMAIGAASAGFSFAAAQTQPATQPFVAPTFSATGIDHVALSVTDVKRSAAFYQKHLGLKLVRESGDANAFLTTSGVDFVALFRGDKPGLHHFSFAIPDYNADDAVKRIEAAGLKAERSDNRVYFPDPDALTVQVHGGRGIAR